MGGGDNGAMPTSIEDIDADKEEEKQEEKEFEELVRGMELWQLKAQFEEAYGPEPKIGRFLGKTKFLQWRSKFLTFVEGSLVGAQNMQKIIRNSGWLKPEIQDMFETREQK